MANMVRVDVGLDKTSPTYELSHHIGKGWAIDNGSKERYIKYINSAIFENIMTTTSKPDQLLLRFRPSDTQNGISRSTVEKLAEYLGFTGETQVIHYALRKLAKEVLPAYEADDGELTPAQLTAIRKAIPQGRAKSVKSSLF